VRRLAFTSSPWHHVVRSHRCLGVWERTLAGFAAGNASGHFRRFLFILID
jgi:hypothetical protein